MLFETPRRQAWLVCSASGSGSGSGSCGHRRDRALSAASLALHDHYYYNLNLKVRSGGGLTSRVKLLAYITSVADPGWLAGNVTLQLT